MREQLEAILRQEIIDQRLAPGQQIFEKSLAKRFSVSRTTVREALRRLAAEGLIENIPQQNAVVSVPTPKQAAEIYELRANLEGLMARKFVERGTAEEVQSLREALEGLENAVLDEQAPDAKARSLLRGKTAFYQCLFAGAHNETARSVLNQFQARVSALRFLSLVPEGRPEASVAELRRVVDAIVAGDAEEAERECCKHVQAAAKSLFQVVQSVEDRDAISGAALGGGDNPIQVAIQLLGGKATANDGDSVAEASGLSADGLLTLS